MFVKIIASLGPSTRDEKTVFEMVKQGVDGFRINLAHGTIEEWKSLLDIVRKAEKEFGKPLALICDLVGPSIRVGFVSKPIELDVNKEITFVFAHESREENIIPVPRKELFSVIDRGDVILMDDGKVRLRVVDVDVDRFKAIALTKGSITSRKVIVVKDKEVDLPTLSEEDFKGLEFIAQNVDDIDYIGLSYVRSCSDIEILRYELSEKLKSLNRDVDEAKRVGIIAKIETRKAIENLDEIASCADALLVARGDLGMHLGLEEIHYYQRLIIEKALQKGKPVIVATQLLESMINNPVPTRAEVVDIGTAVEEGVDAVMLTGETSIGQYPIETIKWLKRILSFVCSKIQKLQPRFISIARNRTLEDLKLRFAKGVIELAEDLEGKIAIYTMRGSTAQNMSTLRPLVPVYAGSKDLKVLRKLSILWGITPIWITEAEYAKQEEEEYRLGLEKVFNILKDRGILKLGDIVLLTYGLRRPKQYIEIQRII